MPTDEFASASSREAGMITFGYGWPSQIRGSPRYALNGKDTDLSMDDTVAAEVRRRYPSSTIHGLNTTLARTQISAVYVDGHRPLDELDGNDEAELSLAAEQNAFQTRERTAADFHMPARRQVRVGFSESTGR